VNFRIEPDVVQKVLPPPFRPKLHTGKSVGGICLIRLEGIRPKGFPHMLRLASENAAHRIAVVWEDKLGLHEGVYIPRRDTGALITHIAGGRLFPGEHHRARFRVADTGHRIELHMEAADGVVNIDVAGAIAPELSPSSSFRSMCEASGFFEAGSIGYSATAQGGRFDGVVLKTHEWKVEPLAVERVHSSYFADAANFPAGSVEFDCALIMRNISHEWHAAEDMYV